jgi:hypothetical protein
MLRMTQLEQDCFARIIEPKYQPIRAGIGRWSPIVGADPADKMGADSFFVRPQRM